MKTVRSHRFEKVPAQTSTTVDVSSLADRIRYHEGEAARLRQVQRDALVVTIAVVTGPGVAFSARELWHHQVLHPELSSALLSAGIRTPRQLGKRLRQLHHTDTCGTSIERLGTEHGAALWVVATR